MAACIEKKVTLSGRIDIFQCELLQFAPDRGVLRYILEHKYNVAGIRLSPGDTTYALYWSGRPYTLYVWHTGSLGPVYYFNIADSVSLSPDTFVWRDLAVDVLVAGLSRPQVLDEDELPCDLPSGLATYIRSATTLVLSTYEALIREADGVISTLQAQEKNRGV